MNAIDFEAIKQKQRVTWASGDFAVIGVTLQIVGEQLAEATDVRSGERVVDVAAGNGNATLAAARRFAHVTSTDYVAELLDRGALRARAEGLEVQFATADAEALPFEDGSFDVALSTFGVMFAPDQQRAARELTRVVRSGGRVGLASWTAEGFIGDLFRLVGRFVPPPPGLAPAITWGDDTRVRELFGPRVRELHANRREFNFRYRSPAHFVEVFRRFYGPTHKAFEVLAERDRARLAVEMEALVARRDIGGGGAVVVPGEYLEVVATVA